MQLDVYVNYCLSKGEVWKSTHQAFNSVFTIKEGLGERGTSVCILHKSVLFVF